MPFPPSCPAGFASRRRWIRVALVGLALVALTSCGGSPARPLVAAPVAPAHAAAAAVHDRAAVLPAAPTARVADAQATRAGVRAPARTAPGRTSALARPPAVTPAGPAPAPPLAPAAPAAPAPAGGGVGPVAVAPPAPPAPTAEEIWAEERARHRAPRAWYGATAPRQIDCLHLKCIALTFDDGPGAGTDDLLDVLAQHNARATFFVQGRNVRTNRASLMRAVWDGHEIGNHTWDHRSLVGRSTSDIARDLLRTSDVIARTAGVRPTLVRPPFGAVDASTAGRVPAPLVLWSVDTDDWRIRDPALVAARVVERAAPGSVVLLHDVYRESVQAVPAVLDHFQRDGYVFVTVSELFGGKVKAGREYHGREVAVQRARAADREAGRVRTVPPEYAPPSPGRLGGPEGPTGPTGQGPFPPAPTEARPLEPGEVDAQRGTSEPAQEADGTAMPAAGPAPGDAAAATTDPPAVERPGPATPGATPREPGADGGAPPDAAEGSTGPPPR